jgi:hypothetical protein
MINLELLDNAIKIPQNPLIFQNFKINLFEYIDIFLKKYMDISFLINNNEIKGQILNFTKIV